MKLKIFKLQCYLFSLANTYNCVCYNYNFLKKSYTVFLWKNQNVCTRVIKIYMQLYINIVYMS